MVARQRYGLIFGAFMFAMGYAKTGLGRRIALCLVKKLGKQTLGLVFGAIFLLVLLLIGLPYLTTRYPA